MLAQFRKVDMKEVFSYPLGPLPWSISDPYGMPRKTNKATLTKNLEKNASDICEYPTDATSIFDGMAILQIYQPRIKSTFRDASRSLFNTFKSTVSNNIHIVFDVYRNVSIKNLERQRRKNG